MLTFMLLLAERKAARERGIDNDACELRNLTGISFLLVMMVAVLSNTLATELPFLLVIQLLVNTLNKLPAMISIKRN